MSFMTFSEDTKKARGRAWLLTIGLVLCYIGITYLLLDIATSGKWYDSLGLQQVLPHGKISIYGASSEGSIFGILLSAIQIYLGFQIATKSRKKDPADWWILVLIRVSVGIFDTYTDMSYRSFDFKNAELTLYSFAVGILLYNVASEYALTKGIGMVSDHFAAVFPFLAELWKVIVDMLESANNILSKNSSHGGKPAGGGGGDSHRPPEHSPRPEPSFHPTSSPRPKDSHFTPSGGGGVNPKELAEKKSRGQMSDDEFFTSMKKLPPPSRRAVMAGLPPKERERLENKMKQEMTQMNVPFGGGMS